MTLHFILSSCISISVACKHQDSIMAYATFSGLLAAASGVSAHLAVFRKGEWDVASPSILVFYFTMFAAALSLSYFPTINVSPGFAAQTVACHVAGLYTSMLLYRAFFHRLSKYPGPVLARLTNFYITALSMKKLHLFEEVQKLHAQYGDYVRLGEFDLGRGYISLWKFGTLTDSLSTQVPGSSPSPIQRLSRPFTGARHPLPKGPGTHYWSRVFLFSWRATSRNMLVAAKSGIKGSPPKVNPLRSSCHSPSFH